MADSYTEFLPSGGCRIVAYESGTWNVDTEVSSGWTEMPAVDLAIQTEG